MKELLRSAPLFLFIVLLLTLAISVYFGNAVKHWSFEGFIGYNANGPLIDPTFQIPKYSTTHSVNKVYDNMYYDPSNAQILELTPGPGPNISDVSNISKITVYNRENAKKTYDVSNNEIVTDASNTIILSSYKAFTIKSVASPDTTPTIIYATWDKDTFIHAIDLSANTSVLSAYFSGSGLTTTKRYFDWDFGSGSLNPIKNRIYDISNIENSTSTPPIDSSDGYPVNVKFYDPSKNPVQIYKDTYYDIYNGNLIVKDASSINIYERPYSTSGTYSDPSPNRHDATNPKTGTTSSITTNGYYPWLFKHPTNKVLIYYIVSGRNTIILVLAKVNGSLQILSSYFYNQQGVNVNSPTPSAPVTPVTPATPLTPATPATPAAPLTPAAPIIPPSSRLAAYYDWLAMWRTLSNASDEEYLMHSSDYMPKTAFIPPGYPAFPQSNGMMFPNFGGGGGGGTVGNKNKFSDFVVLYGGGSAAGIPGTDSERAYQLAQNAGSGTVGLVRDAGAAGLGALAVGTVLGAEAVGGTVDLAKDAVGGTVGLAKDTVGGAVGLAKETVGGAVGLAKDAGSGLANVLNAHPMQFGGNGSGGEMYDPTRTQGQGTRGGKGSSQNRIDPYSYNGALVSKGGNYIPITTDFSAFGR